MWCQKENTQVCKMIRIIWTELKIWLRCFRCVPVLDSIHSPTGERVAQSSVYDSGISHHSEEDQSSSLSSSLSSLEMTDERTEIILAATFLLIVVLSFVAWVHFKKMNMAWILNVATNTDKVMYITFNSHHLNLQQNWGFSQNQTQQKTEFKFANWHILFLDL